MELLRTLGEKSSLSNPVTRKAARAVVFDPEGNVALLHVSNHHYYKLPGGGIEKGETALEGLRRECLEEIGCDIEVTGEVGRIIEYRHYPEEQDIDQESFCYLAKVKGEKGQAHLEQGEIDEGFRQEWVSLQKAIELFKNSKPDSSDGPFITARDLKFIEEASRQITN
jgi:8-oxo-dGTP pyrophosphatase MutT (NUDIX family)